MRKAKLKEFRRLYYTPDSAPAPSTLRGRIDRGELPGGHKEGGLYYVDIDEYDAATHISATLEKRREQLKQEPLLQGLI